MGRALGLAVLFAACACAPRSSVRPASVTLPVAAQPVLRVTAAIASPAERLRAHTGRLMPSMVDRILNSPSYLEAKQLTYSPEFRALPPDARKPLEAEWKKVQAEGAVLLREARKLDREGNKLFRQGRKLEKDASSLTRKRDALNLSSDQWGRDCAQEDRRCQKRKTSLERLAHRLERRIVQHNAGVAKWREEVAGLERRVGLE